ncbi:MAG TPA: FliM/FliN family flagellar motor switch protein [Anaeromyxobacteraceae bacterium]|nr:FliM/FliN family flagellar motor switch protein [Anaeromyxobacteraceae bacterium]
MALPFELPAVSRGYADLDRTARAAGASVLDAVRPALAAVLGAPVAVTARPVPARASPGAGTARIALELRALPASAVLEVEVPLVARLVDGLAGGRGDPIAATELTPVEASALELLALAALDAACAVSDLDERLGPRLVRSGAAPPEALAIELDIAVGAIRGRARLLAPARAVRALRGPGLPDPMPGIRVEASIRSGHGALMPAELDVLAPGDVVVLDAPPGDRHALVLPGGARAEGRLDGQDLHVETIAMPDRASELPITLEVELGRVSIALADLARLEPGAILPLGLDRRGLVTLRAGERAVARGELVEVEGAVGVRIHALEVSP